jgi:hypothetical protein
MSERIERLRAAVAAQSALEKRAAKRGRKNAAVLAHRDLENAIKAQRATPCALPPYRACLLAEAEKRIKRGDRGEAIQTAILLRATGERRFAERFKAILAEKPSMDEALDIPAELAAAKAGDLLEAFAKAHREISGYESVVAVTLFFSGDRAGYAAVLGKIRAEGRLYDLAAAAIAQRVRDPALFAEALEKALAFTPEYVPLRLNEVIIGMAYADMADEVRSLAARKERPVANPDFRVAALAIVAGKRQEIDRLQELDRGLQPEGVERHARSRFSLHGMALGWAFAGRIEEAAAIFRAELIVVWAPDVLAAIAVAHARAGRAREAIDVLMTLDFSDPSNRTVLVRAFADVAAALR